MCFFIKNITHKAQLINYKEKLCNLLISLHCKGSGNLSLVFNLPSNSSRDMLLLPYLFFLYYNSVDQFVKPQNSRCIGLNKPRANLTITEIIDQILAIILFIIIAKAHNDRKCAPVHSSLTLLSSHSF